MSDDLGFPHDHETIAWEHFLSQHIDKEHTEDFVRSFYGPLNDLDSILNSMYVDRWLETAQGDALTGIGSIVGISRYSPIPIYKAFFGFKTQPSGRGFGVARIRRTNEAYEETNVYGDAEYRTAIQCKIALNNGHGTAEEIMAALNSVMNITTTHVYDRGNATAAVYIPVLLTPSDPQFYIINQMIPKSGGVKIYVNFTDPDRIFGFLSQGFKGFGVGILARQMS